MRPHGRSDSDRLGAFEDMLQSLATLRTESNVSPHGVIGDRQRRYNNSSAHPNDKQTLSSSTAPCSTPPTNHFTGEAPLRSFGTDPSHSAEDLPLRMDVLNVIMWFRRDLNASQRLSMVRSLTDILDDEQRSEIVNYLQLLNSKSRKAALTDPVSPLAQNGTPLWPSTENLNLLLSSSGTTRMENTINDLFYSDLGGWFRIHRLHKYEPVLKLVSPRASLLYLDDKQMEELGIGTQGARHKLLKLFSAIHSASQHTDKSGTMERKDGCIS